MTHNNILQLVEIYINRMFVSYFRWNISGFGANLTWNVTVSHTYLYLMSMSLQAQAFLITSTLSWVKNFLPESTRALLKQGLDCTEVTGKKHAPPSDLVEPVNAFKCTFWNDSRCSAWRSAWWKRCEVSVNWSSALLNIKDVKKYGWSRSKSLTAVNCRRKCEWKALYKTFSHQKHYATVVFETLEGRRGVCNWNSWNQYRAGRESSRNRKQDNRKHN